MKEKKNNYPWSNKVYIIAEAGVNHNGKLSLAKKLILKAKQSGADAVKFQTWVEGELTGKFTKKIGYVKENFKTKLSRYKISRKLSLSFNEFLKLKKYAKKIKIDFLTTPCGVKSLKFAVNKLKVKYIKIGSSELNNLEFLRTVSLQKKPVFLSTGMGNLQEVKEAYKIFKKNNKHPTFIFQCTSQYPCEDKNANINVIKTFKKNFPDIGFSDHTIGCEASISAISLGAKVIEKHFTLNKNYVGPDHKASLNIIELKNFVNSIRRTEKLLGSIKKLPVEAEKKIISQTRRGVVAAMNLKKGIKIKKHHIKFKRPATGLSPKEYSKAINKFLKINLKEDQPIMLKYLR